MSIEIEGPKTPVALQYRTMLERSLGAACTSCGHHTVNEDFAYVSAYRARSRMMKELVPKENIAAYGVCKECAKLPEGQVFAQVENTLVQHGLCKNDHKPLGTHLPGHKHKHKRGNGM